jgi:predicted O-methyltransferase YrrM
VSVTGAQRLTIAPGGEQHVVGESNYQPAREQATGGRTPDCCAISLITARAAHLAYVDEPIRIPHGQVTTQPSLIARMVQALRLAGSERVLEVGTGLGFQAAILAMLARDVVSVERFADLAEQARANLEAVGLGHVRVVVG